MISRVKNIPLQLERNGRTYLLSNPIEYLSCSVNLYGFARRHKNEANDTEEERNSQSLKSTENIENFGEGGFHYARRNVGDNSNNRNERM